ncbi:MAG TPA: hemolysin III family protein [Gemmatimonadales bacterium]|jgi:hemolysin III|nr:hemolysin III family protein [Gemmatimonadales bacterium]
MRLREPFNAGSHFVGLLLAVAGTWLLLRGAEGWSQMLAFGVYGATLMLLYAASTVYHGVNLGAAGIRRLRTLDHIAIYFLIAGTYTPVAAITLRDAGGPTLLAASWTIAAAGIPFKIRWLDAPVWISTGSYLGMGYLALVAVVPLAREVGAGLGWLVAGGIAYTIGAVIYAVERPDPLPGRLGHHGLWHILVLVGSACHFAFIALHVAPF